MRIIYRMLGLYYLINNFGLKLSMIVNLYVEY